MGIYCADKNKTLQITHRNVKKWDTSSLNFLLNKKNPRKIFLICMQHSKDKSRN